MGAPRWTEQPTDAGPIEPLPSPVTLYDGRRAARGLPWDPGGGWGTDDSGEATTFAVNIAVPEVAVLWGSRTDLGPGTVGGQRATSGFDERLPGQFHQGERIVIPIPDSGGEFDIQTWAAFRNESVGAWEWGRVNIHGQPARRRFTFPPHTQPWPEPRPATKTSTQVRNEVVPVLKAWEASQSGPIDLSRIQLARRILEMTDAQGWNRDRAAGIRELLDTAEE